MFCAGCAFPVTLSHAFGMIVFAWFLLGLVTGRSFAEEGRVEEDRSHCASRCNALKLAREQVRQLYEEMFEEHS